MSRPTRGEWTEIFALSLFVVTSMSRPTRGEWIEIKRSIDVKSTQALLGRADPTMTLRVYAKTEQTKLPTAVSQIDDYLS